MAIPRILFRSVPQVTTPAVDSWWAIAQALHSGWEFIEYRDPINPDLFPLTAPHWDKCTSGAQLAGLIRLEAAFNHGGFWLDADYEVWRNLEPLRQARAVAAWEDARVIPDAFLGFEKGHPALLPMIGEAIGKLHEGAWESGPGVTTRRLQGRDDVMILPPQAIFPMHYKIKARYDHTTTRGQNSLEQLRAQSPWAWGVHHWNHSWAGH